MNAGQWLYLCIIVEAFYEATDDAFTAHMKKHYGVDITRDELRIAREYVDGTWRKKDGMFHADYEEEKERI